MSPKGKDWFDDATDKLVDDIVFGTDEESDNVER